MIIPLFKLFDSSYDFESTDDETSGLTCPRCKDERKRDGVDLNPACDRNSDGDVVRADLDSSVSVDDASTET